MKRVIIIIMAMVGFISATAKKYSYSFHNAPVSQALVELNQDHPDINIAFIYKELDNYKTSSKIDTDDIYTAIRHITGLFPITVSERSGIYYVEALQRGKYLYTGRIVDSGLEPLAGVSVRLLNPRDSVVVTYGFSESNGSFNIPCDMKGLIAKVSCIGYMTSFGHANDFHFEDIVMHENPIMLNQVTVEEQSVILAADKNIYVPSHRQKQFSTTGTDLLRHMAIPMLVVTPGNNTVTDVFGTVCVIFINYSPASNDDLSALNISNVRRVEVYDSPSDPRFRGAQKAINIVVQEYTFGGYTKVMASETTLNGFDNRSNVFNKFTYKRMTYDLYVGVTNSISRHSSSDIKSQSLLMESAVNRNEYTDNSKNDQNIYPLTFRASYNTNRLQVKNLVSFTHGSTPEQSQTGHIVYDNRNDMDYKFNRNNRFRSTDLNYKGSLYWVHPSDFAIDYSQSVAYTRRNTASNYYVNPIGYFIDNNAIEDRTDLRLDLYGLKAFGAKHRLRFGTRIIFLNDKVVYTEDDNIDNLKALTGGATVQYTFSSKAFKASTHVGLGMERYDINKDSNTETTPFGNINMSWRMSGKSSLSAYASYGMWTPGVDMRQDVVLQNNEFLYLTGNSNLQNYARLNTNLAYNYAPNNKFIMAAFAGYDEWFNRVATIYSPYGDEALLRSYVNDGNYSNFYIGVSGDLKLFNNNLQLYGNITQKSMKTTGIYNNSLSPLRVQLQASYYWKSFYALAWWSSKPHKLTENSNIIIHGRESYGIEGGWGNGNWVVKLMAKNIFRFKWNSETWEQRTPLYYEWKTIYSTNTHASLNLSITYTFDYGKKTRRGNEVGASEISPSAIIKP